MAREFLAPVVWMHGDKREHVVEILTPQAGVEFLTGLPAAKKVGVHYEEALSACTRAAESDLREDVTAARLNLDHFVTLGLAEFGDD